MKWKQQKGKNSECVGESKRGSEILLKPAVSNKKASLAMLIVKS